MNIGSYLMNIGTYLMNIAAYLFNCTIIIKYSEIEIKRFIVLIRSSQTIYTLQLNLLSTDR